MLKTEVIKRWDELKPETLELLEKELEDKKVELQITAIQAKIDYLTNLDQKVIDEEKSKLEAQLTALTAGNIDN